ncbi:MAG: sigma-54 dependent transcriptional regulator [Nitrospira sp.]|nr:sigma-54 dependent transcriptional regulator [Nitrospira sp.]
MSRPTILLITKDPTMPQLLHATAPPSSTILTASTIVEGMKLWQTTPPSLIVCEGSPQSMIPLLEFSRQTIPFLPIVAIGEGNSVRDAVAVLRAGAADYLVKPVTPEELQAVVTRLLHQPSTEAVSASQDRFAQIISVSPQMNLIKQLAREVAATDATVLITGESGTGKELFAQAIHAASPRARGPLIALNCAGIPEPLLEAELFGYQQGAFTDAKHSKPGRFQMAEGGTLFLDEIGEMSAAAQAKLLRVLEDHVVDPLGATRSQKVNLRVIAATNEDLPARIKAGQFRLDLYYRLNVYQLRIPPLRERPEDIEAILMVFLERARRERGCPIRAIAPEALVLLKHHDWPGNVRELHNVVEWLTITCKHPTIQPDHLPPSVRTPSAHHGAQREPRFSLLDLGLSLEELEKRLLQEALDKTAGNVSEASRLLKISRNTLRYRLAKHHLRPNHS